jgi:hypothetical protein
VGNPKDPDRDLGGVAHTVQLFLDFHKGFLNQVVGRRFIPHRGQDEFSHPLVEMVVDLKKVHFLTRTRLSAAGPFDQTEVHGSEAFPLPIKVLIPLRITGWPPFLTLLARSAASIISSENKPKPFAFFR